MLLLAAAAIASAPPQTLAQSRLPVSARVQAQATIRIISGAELHFGEDQHPDGFTARDAVIRSTGASEPAKLIEFE